MKVISFRWADNRWAKNFARNKRMKRKVKFGFVLISAVIQYCIEKRDGKEVMSKREFWHACVQNTLKPICMCEIKCAASQNQHFQS